MSDSDDRPSVTHVEDGASLADARVEPWPVRDTEVVWENPYFTAGYDIVDQPNGELGRYYWIEPPDVASIVARTSEGHVVLIEQYSPRQEQSLLTCPGGGVEGDETFAEAGQRELREETGFQAGTVEMISTFRPSGWVRMTQAIVFACDLDPGPTDLDPGECHEIITAPPDVAIDAVRSRSPGFISGPFPLLVARDEGLLA